MLAVPSSIFSTAHGLRFLSGLFGSGFGMRIEHEDSIPTTRTGSLSPPTSPIAESFTVEKSSTTLWYAPSGCPVRYIPHSSRSALKFSTSGSSGKSLNAASVSETAPGSSTANMSVCPLAFSLARCAARRMANSQFISSLLRFVSRSENAPQRMSASRTRLFTTALSARRAQKSTSPLYGPDLSPPRLRQRF